LGFGCGCGWVWSGLVWSGCSLIPRCETDAFVSSDGVWGFRFPFLQHPCVRTGVLRTAAAPTATTTAIGGRAIVPQTMARFAVSLVRCRRGAPLPHGTSSAARRRSACELLVVVPLVRVAASCLRRVLFWGGERAGVRRKPRHPVTDSIPGTGGDGMPARTTERWLLPGSETRAPQKVRCTPEELCASTHAHAHTHRFSTILHPRLLFCYE